MPLSVRKPEDAKFLKALIFGPPGQGKTRLLGTAQLDERTAPMLFLNFEGGDQTLAGLDIDVVDIRDWQDYNEAHAYLSSDKCEYRSVGIDSVTETQVNGLLTILEKDARRADPDQLAQPDWGVILTQMRRFVRGYKFLPMHVFFTALSKDAMVPRIGTVKQPSVQGAFADELPGVVDVVSYLAKEVTPEGVTQRVLLLRDEPRFSVKARTPWDREIPAEIVDPTITKLLDSLGF